MKQGTFLSALCLVHTLSSNAQSGILWDKDNRQPVTHASIYTNQGGNILATSSDENGFFTVSFPFRELTISHINYEQQQLSNLKEDTIFLKPKSQLLAEVVVNNNEPKWIRKKLQTFLKNKSTLYQPSDCHMAYEYYKANVGDSSGYAFQSKGLMYIPSTTHIRKDSMYRVCPDQNIIQYKDTTAGPDFYDMQLMLYENVVEGLDNKFIRKHKFCENKEYASKNSSIVQINFWSERYKEDKGYLLMDTTNCAIIEARQTTGLAYNLENKMNSLVLSVAKLAVGLEYEDWTIDNVIHFQHINGKYYPQSITYKYYERRSNYNKFAAAKHKQLIQHFASREASLVLSPAQSTSTARYYDIPHEIHWAIIYTESKRHARNRVAIQKEMPRHYKLFGETQATIPKLPSN